MKSTALYLTLIYSLYCRAYEPIQNEQIVHYAEQWKHEHIDHISIHDVSIITGILLLSYDIVTASLQLAHAKLIIQKELLKITTLDIGSTLQTKDLLKKNDTTRMKKAIQDLEQAQESIHVSCAHFESLFPLFIQTEPSISKIFIKNIKQAVFDWALQQNDIIEEFTTVKKEFIADAQLVNRITLLFDSIIHHIPSERNQLLDGATNISDMYKKIETTLFQFTRARQKSVEKFEELLVFFFKKHYQVLYTLLQNAHIQEINFKNNTPMQLPHPDEHFIIITH